MRKILAVLAGVGKVIGVVAVVVAVYAGIMAVIGRFTSWNE